MAQATLPADADADADADAEALRAFALSLQGELYAKTLHIEKLNAQLAVLRRARFGRSSETLDRYIEQLELLIGELEESDSESQSSVGALCPGTRPPPSSITRSRRHNVRE